MWRLVFVGEDFGAEGVGNGDRAAGTAHVAGFHPLRALIGRGGEFHHVARVGLYLDAHDGESFGVLFRQVVDVRACDFFRCNVLVTFLERDVEQILQVGAVMVYVGR